MDSECSRRRFMGMAGATALAEIIAPPSAISVAGGSEINQSKAERDRVVRTSPKKPNIILFMPDELRADALSCFGNPICRTPNFDKLASEGTKFSNCYVQFPVCGASRCSLLTGWPTSVRGHRSLYYFLRPEEPNLFRYLRQNGYDVFWYGKNDALAAQSFYQSVTEWNDEFSPPPSAREFSRNPWTIGDPHYYSFLFTKGGDQRGTLDYQHLQAGIRILEREHLDRPFCLFLPLTSPHPPYAGPAEFHDLYDPAKLPRLRPIGLPNKPNFYEGIRKAYHIDSLPESTFRKIRAVYLGMVSYTDWLLGELLEAVDRTQHTNDTAVFVLSDHGDYAGDYGLVEKWTSDLGDVLTHVPLIARVPGGVRTHVSENIVELFDVMATCLELAGIDAQHTHFSRSLLPQIHGRRGDSERAAFCEGGYNTYEPQCFEPAFPPEEIYYAKTHLQLTQPDMISRSAMVRTRSHKLILRPSGQSELYAYGQDPDELHNLYGDASVAGVQHELERRLAEWYIKTAGIAPFDKDQRNAPAYYPTPDFRRTDQRDKVHAEI
ncbi:MAG TPA: sulfatase-like hydrolase/transferase [Terriglobia bacterium]|nr:sulfatase-like hydrolase/transferase [Terriglobia bacterium]